MPRVKRGPKPKTRANSRPNKSAGIWSDAEIPSMTDGARKEFNRLVGVIERAGVKDRTDLSVVVNAARLSDLIDRAHAEVEAIGLVLVTENLDGETKTKANPMLATVNSLTRQHLLLMKDLGLVPSTSKLTDVSTPTGTDDPMSDFLTIVG